MRYFFFFFFLHEFTCKTYCTAVDIFQRGLIGTIIFFKDSCKKNIGKKPKYIFIFCNKKKRKQKRREKSVKEIIFWEGFFY